MKNRRIIFFMSLIGAVLLGLVGCTPEAVDQEPAAAPLPLEEVTSTPTIEPEPTAIIEIETAVPLPTNTPQPTKPTNPPTPEKPLEESVPAKPTIAMPADPTVQEWVQQAKDDLAQRLGVAVDQIDLVEYQSVSWRDGSLGCPRPGMSYTQALREGYRLQLQVNGQQYDYHGATGQAPFYCENPNPKGNLEAPGLGDT
jgi:hypothetical protein